MRLLIALGALLALAGCASPPVTWVSLPVPACPGAVVDLATADATGLLDVHVAECRSSASGDLLGERAAVDILGAAAWRRGGPPADLVHIVVDRSADWLVPRSFTFTDVQATEAWGKRPVVTNAFSPRRVGAFTNAVLWISVFFGTLVPGVVVLVVLVRSARRGDIVVIWWFR